jgi:hypothetical protein
VTETRVPASARRILVLGGAGAGKTTLARRLARDRGIPHRSTDELIHEPGLDWSGVSERVAREWLAQSGPWVIEGTRVAHALRKWRTLNPKATGLPVDCVVAMLGRPWVRRSAGQESQAAGIGTIWHSVEPWVRRGGVAIVRV